MFTFHKLTKSSKIFLDLAIANPYNKGTGSTLTLLIERDGESRQRYSKMTKADLLCEMVGLLEDAITYYEHDNANLFLLYYGRAQAIEWLLMEHFDWYSEVEGGYPMDLLDTCFTYCSHIKATKED